jgi:hypothetical protein
VKASDDSVNLGAGEVVCMFGRRDDGGKLRFYASLLALLIVAGEAWSTYLR